MSEPHGESKHLDGDTSTCANCGQPVRFRHPESHVRGFWTHDDGKNREGRESFSSTCALTATPADIGSNQQVQS